MLQGPRTYAQAAATPPVAPATATKKRGRPRKLMVSPEQPPQHAPFTAQQPQQQLTAPAAQQSIATPAAVPATTATTVQPGQRVTRALAKAHQIALLPPLEKNRLVNVVNKSCLE